MSRVDNCPKCNISFIGDKITDESAKYYAGTHWRKEKSISGFFSGIYDGIVARKCFSCGHEFPRGSSEWALELFKKYKESK